MFCIRKSIWGTIKSIFSTSMGRWGRSWGIWDIICGKYGFISSM
jgi:hypothetical protein